MRRSVVLLFANLRLGGLHMSQKGVRIGPPQMEDAADMWRLVEASGTLDHNSFYLYFVLCRFFAETSAVAHEGEQLVGFATAFTTPQDAATLFLWQLRVDPDSRGRGIAKSLLGDVLSRPKLAHITHFQATVAPDNTASLSVMRSIARDLSAPIHETPALVVSAFPQEVDDHPPENLISVGPFVTVSIANRERGHGPSLH